MRDKILNELNHIFHQVVGCDDVILKIETESKDITLWDSIIHIRFIIAIEAFYKIRISPGEIIEWKNIGSICECIQKKISKQT